MKLHLNLTLRRAVLAAMAMVALHTAEAAITTEKGNMYITGEEAPSAAEWTQAWGSNTGVLSVGTSEGVGTLTLDSGTYTTPNAIFLAGKGYDTDGTVANAGIIVVKKGATLTTPAHLNVGNSLVGGNGVLTLEGGTVNAGSGLYVGVNAGWGVINATDATIIVNSAPTGGTGEQQYVFAMGYYDGAGKDNTAVLRNSKISVGTTGGSLDFATIGRGPGKAILDLDKESTADFAAQTLVGEKAGSEGVIFVSGGSKLNLGDTTVLGVEKGAKGAISADAGTVTASDLVIGKAGKGTFTVQNNGSLGADYITAGDDAGSDGTLEIKTKTGTVTAKELLTVGDAGTGTLTNAGTLTAKTIVVGNAETAVGSLTSTGTVTVSDKLYVGYKGTGTITVNDGSLTAGDTYIVGVNSELSTEKGTTTLANATVLGGELETRAGATTNVTGELVMNAGGILSTAGNTDVAEALVHEGTKVEVETGGSLTTGTVVNEGTVENNGTWKIKGATTSTVGTVINNGTMNVESSLTSGAVDGNGTVKVNEGGSWAITGQTTQDRVENAGDITLTGNGRLDAGSLTGSGVTTIVVDGTSLSTSDDLAVIELANDSDTSNIKVDIDTDNGAALVGKTVDFVKVKDSLVELTNFNVDEGWTINWDSYSITTGDASNGKQISFEGDKSGMTFTKMGAIETQKVEVELPANVSIELEVVTETVVAATESLETKGEKVVANESSVEINETDMLHSAVLNQGVDKETQQDVSANVIIGKNVTSEGTGSTNVQSLVINQKTKIDKEGTADDDDVIRETLGVTGTVLQFEGKTKHTGTGKDKGSELGFNEGTKDGKLETKKGGETVVNEVKKVDVIGVAKDSEVEVTDMSMHSTHALVVEAGSTLTFNNVNLHVGGTEDINLTKEVEVVVYDENGEPKKDAAGNVVTEIQTVETDAHMTVDTLITKATVKVQGTSAVKFEKVDNDDHTTTFGSTTIAESTVEIGAEATMGDNADHMQEIVFTDNTTVTNSGTVNKAKFDKGSKIKNNNGTLDNVVISNGSHLTGTGNAKRVHVDKDSKLTVGSSPGVLKASDLTVDGAVEFYVITNSAEWDTFGGDSSKLTTTYGSGSISQLVVDGSVTLNGAVSFVYQQKLADGSYANWENQKEAADSMKDKFMEGVAIQFIAGDTDSLTLGSGFYVDTNTLPTLEDGMFWDASEFLTTGIVRVQSEILEEPTRVANTLVSAGETVLNFGRLAESQAALREAGTTRAWASAISNFDSIDNGATTNGYDYSNWGAAVGVDHAFTKNTVLGVAFGCTWGENDPNDGNGFYDAGSIDQDSKMVALYGVHKFRTKGLMNDVKLSAFAAYGWFENDSTRTGIKSGHKATAEWDSDAWVLSASLSRDITTDDGVVFTPYVGVEYTKAGMDDFTEKGKSYDADYTADTDYSNLAVKVGMTVSKTFGSFTPYAGIAYIGDVDRSAAEVTARGKRTIEGKSALPGRDALQLSVGASWQLTESMDLNAGYSAEIRNKATEHNANIGIGLTF